jgi:hydroxyacylglutathione hydrolase
MLEIHPIHAFTDNFIWCLARPGGDTAWVVDPGEAAPVLEALAAGGLRLGGILVTHKHGDHVGGIGALTSAFPGIPVVGPANEPIPGVTQPVGEGHALRPEGLGITLRVLEVPGHTEGHVAYYAEPQAGPPLLFCGDTLFSVGCGRVFSGTHEQLHDSLMRLAALPGATLVHCAHEYTLDNIGFAKWVEPDNPALLAREAEARARLDAGGETVPSTLETERATNPFLRVRESAVIAAAERKAGRRLADGREVFTVLRRWKDTEYD